MKDYFIRLTSDQIHDRAYAAGAAAERLKLREKVEDLLPVQGLEAASLITKILVLLETEKGG